MRNLLFIGCFLIPSLISAQEQITRYTYHDEDKSQLKEIFHVRDTFNNILEGPYFSYYLNGNIESKGQFSNNETVGVWEFYYETGNLKMRGALRNNSNYGNWEYFFENGNKQMEGKIINRKREGHWKMYYESGELKSEGEFKANRRSGLWKYWYESGQLKGETTYNEGKGTSIEYYQTGEKKAEGNKDGLKNIGHWIFYYQDGNKQAEGSYTRGERSGEWKFYHVDGQLSSKGNYDDDMPADIWSYYNEEGELITRGEFSKGKKKGIWNAYYPGGSLKSETEYRGDTGVFKEYYENAALKATGKLFNNTKVGAWKYYYPNGELEGEVVLNNGKGIYTGYYPDGTIYTKGLIENDQRIGTWEIYNKSGELKGYYKPFYNSDLLNTEALQPVEIKKEKRNYGVADYGYKTSKFHYFKPKINEFRGLILSTNPITPFIGRFPVGIEFYYQERLGYELLIEIVRDPFYIADEDISSNTLYSRGFTVAFRQKFYNAEGRFGLFYFGHGISYANFNHHVNLEGEESELTLTPTASADELNYIYSIIAGFRLMEYTYSHGFTVDGYIGIGTGFRQLNIDEGFEDHFESLSGKQMPVKFTFGVTFGYVYPLKKRR